MTIPTDRMPTEAEVTRFLRSMGDTPGAVADWLFNHGITGKLGDPWRCPIAMALIYRFPVLGTPGPFVFGISTFIRIARAPGEHYYSAEGGLTIIMPAAVCDFIINFDSRDMYPHLRN